MNFSVKLTPADLFAFNMYHTYTHSTGYVSILLGLFSIGFGIYRWNVSTDILYNLLFIGAGIMLIVYIPVTLWLRAGAAVKPGGALSAETHYTLTEDNLSVSIGENTAEMPWTAIYKLKNKAKRMYIYTNRVNAFIIPKRCITKEIEDTIISYYKKAEEGEII